VLEERWEFVNGGTKIRLCLAQLKAQIERFQLLRVSVTNVAHDRPGDTRYGMTPVIAPV
jgi:hypothetical protein